MAGLDRIRRSYVLLILMMALTAIPGCSSGEAASEQFGMQPPDGAASDTGEFIGEPVTVTIGNLTDLSGPSASAMDVLNMALDDIVRYYNEDALIPGVELEVIKYDGRLDPARDIAGYEWLRENGADIIFTGVPGTPVTLGPLVNQDEVLLFSVAASLEVLDPPGYVFALGAVPQREAYTFLRWLSVNDWDYEANGPAKVGGAGWTDSYSPGLIAAAREYCEAHPDEFEWVGGYLTDFSFAWDREVRQLKDADYVFPPNVPTTFVKQYRDVGGTGKMLFTDPHMAFMGMIKDANLWPHIDGSLALLQSRWWNERGSIIDLTRELLYTYHPRVAEQVKHRGVGYLGVTSAYQLAEVIRLAAEKAGPESLDSEALYDAAQSLWIVIDGVPQYSFSATKRASVNFYGVYELNADWTDLIRLNDQWYPGLYAATD